MQLEANCGGKAERVGPTEALIRNMLHFKLSHFTSLEDENMNYLKCSLKVLGTGQPSLDICSW